MNTLKLGPQISSLLKSPEATLDNWQGELTDIRSRHNNFRSIRVGSLEAEAAFADLLPLRFVANAYLAKKTLDIFVRDNLTDTPLPVPSPYSFRSSQSPDMHPYAVIGLSIRQAMRQSAKKVRHSHQYDFEPKVVKFADTLNAIDYRLRRGEGAVGWRFEDHTIWRGEGTATNIISAFLGATPVLLDEHSSSPPTTEQIYDTAQASHRVPLMAAASNIPTVVFSSHLGLNGDTAKLLSKKRRPLVVLPHQGSTPVIGFSQEIQEELAKERDWATRRGTLIPHMGCLALARMPDLMSDWRGQSKPPLSNAINQQIDWMAKHWRDTGLWEQPTAEAVRKQSEIWFDKATYKPLAISALHGLRSAYGSMNAGVMTAIHSRG